MHSLSQDFLENLRLSAAEAATVRKIGEYLGKQKLYAKQAPEVLETLKNAAVVESTESSNRLEGIVAPQKRIRALVLKSVAPRNRSEQEIAGYRDVLALIHESAPSIPFTNNVLLQFHTMLYRYMPQDGGRWKMADNQIVERAPNGTISRVRFNPVSALETPASMKDLVERYEGVIREHEPLVIIPLTILDFLCVHPFSDGNGRISRLLTLLLLYHAGYEVGRYISLERIFEESKESYYENLETCSQGWHKSVHEARPWLSYFWGILIRAYKEFETRVGTMETAKGTKTDQVKRAIQSKILPFSITDLEQECPGVSRDMIRKVLRDLRDDGQLKTQGRGPAAKWIRIGGQ